MEDYINGCYTKYGTRSLNIFEIKRKIDLGNGYACAIGYIENEKDGLSIDLLKDNKVFAWEHNIHTNMDPKNLSEDSFEMLIQLAQNRLREMRLL